MKNTVLKLSAVALALFSVFVFSMTASVACKARTANDGGAVMAKALASAQPTFTGQDKESLYNLSIEMSVSYDDDAKLYKVSGTAKWYAAKKGSAETKPENLSFDFIKVTWGGNGALHAQDVSVYGEYRGGKEMSVSKNTSDSLKCFVWQFEEMEKSSPMSFANFSFNLVKTGAAEGKETDVRMTYVHTYSKLKTSVLYGLGVGKIMPTILSSVEEKSWQIEIGVAKIIY